MATYPAFSQCWPTAISTSPPCTGLRLYLDAARRFPLFARFVGRVGPESIGTGGRVQDYIPVHLAAAIRDGEFVDAQRHCHVGQE